MEQFQHLYTGSVALIGVWLIVGAIIGFIKAADWLIGLKYKTKDCCSSTMADFCMELSKKFATIESHNYLKEDIDEIKMKLNDIHDVVMTFAVNSFKDKK